MKQSNCSGMGDWKRKALNKGQRASRTKSGKARIYYAIPPSAGWAGGMPLDNGSRRK